MERRFLEAGGSKLLEKFEQTLIIYHLPNKLNRQQDHYREKIVFCYFNLKLLYCSSISKGDI